MFLNYQKDKKPNKPYNFYYMTIYQRRQNAQIKNSKKLLPLFLLPITIFPLIFSGCSKRESNNIAPQIEIALTYIENNYFGEAEKILKDIKSKDPQNCEASYGLALIHLRNLVEVVNSILSIAFGFNTQGSPKIPGQEPEIRKYTTYYHEDESRIKIVLNRIAKKGPFSEAIYTLIRPAFIQIDEIAKNITVVLSKKCHINVALPIKIGNDQNTILHFYIGQKGGPANRWGPTEAAILGFFTNIFDAILKFILAINWDINIEKLLDFQVKINLEGLENLLGQQSQIVTPQGTIQNLSLTQIQILNSALSFDPFDTAVLFSSLAFIFDTSPDLLRLRSDGDKILDEVAEHISIASDTFLKIFEFITKYSDKNSIIAYEDPGKDGLSPDDFVDLNTFRYPDLQKGLFAKIGNTEIKFDKTLLSVIIKPFLYKETREKYLKFFSKMKIAFDIKNENIDDNQRWISIKEALSLIPLISVQETIRFNPKRFFDGLKKNSEGLRAILPLWTDLTGDGIPEFIIEAESKSINDKFCFAPQDRIKNKFIVKPLIQLQGEKISFSRLISIIYSKGEISQDYWCYISPELDYSGKYQMGISAEMFIKNIDLKVETKELIFQAIPCEAFSQDETNFACYKKIDNQEKIFVKIKNDEGKINEYEIEKAILDNQIYKDFESKIISRFTKPITFMGQYIVPSVKIKPDSEQKMNLEISWNDIEIPDKDVNQYDIEIFYPETGTSSDPIFLSENAPGVKKCVGGICSEKDEDCSGAICLYNIGNIENFLQGHRKICLRIKAYTVEGVIRSHYKCLEFPQGLTLNPNEIDRFEKLFKTSKGETNLFLEVKTYSRPKMYSLKEPIYISRRAEIEGDNCIFNMKIVLALAPFKVELEGDKAYFTPYLPAEIFVRSSDFRDDFQDKVVQGLAIRDIDNFFIENVAFLRRSQKYKVFSAFFSPKEEIIPRYYSITSFPQLSTLVVGCAALIPRCFFNSDSPHFPSEIIAGGIRKNIRINRDCQFPDNEWSLYYIAFRDPTFFGSIQVNLDPLKKCEGDPEGWIEPDNYTLNKVSVDFIQRVISPIVSLFSNLVGIITGQLQYISEGVQCNF